MKRRMGFAIHSERQKSGSDASVLVPEDFRHALIEGGTGSGKTSSFVLPNINSRLAAGHSIVVFDFKGNLHLQIKHLCVMNGRLDDFIHMGVPHGTYINLLGYMDRNDFYEAVLYLGGRLSDTYWSNAAASLCSSILDILRTLKRISEMLKNEYDLHESFNVAEIDGSEYEVPIVDPAFSDIYKIVSGPRSFMLFQEASSIVAERTEMAVVASGLAKTASLSEKDMDSYQILVAQMQKLKKELDAVLAFSVDIKGNASGGNNGVLQIAEMALRDASRRDYLNYEDTNLLKRVEGGAVVCVDTQGVDAKVYGAFLQSLMKRLSSRVRGSISPASATVLVDEANRVLPENADLSLDVARESRCQVLLAVQAEEQMIEKYGEAGWAAVAENIIHRYSIDDKHMFHIESEDMSFYPEPLCVSSKEMEEAEICYMRLQSSRNLLLERFFVSNLPGNMVVEYIPPEFDRYETVLIRDADGGRTAEAHYAGTKKISIQKTALDYLGLEDRGSDEWTEEDDCDIDAAKGTAEHFICMEFE